jgi:hypothetical protein
MGFFSKLFGKKLKEETRIVGQSEPQPEKVKWGPSNEDYNFMLASHLNDAMTTGKLKRYQNVVKFVDSVAMQKVPQEIYNVYEIKVTPEIESLKKLWKRLKYKCSDEVISGYMTE